MPFKDASRKKEYQRQYKARLREAKARAQAPPLLKVYFCPRFPNLIIGTVEFRGGYFVTACPEKQRFLEGLVDYGPHIISWVADPPPDEGGDLFF